MSRSIVSNAVIMPYVAGQDAYHLIMLDVTQNLSGKQSQQQMRGSAIRRRWGKRRDERGGAAA